jgi:uncharacterized phiE125 gp8 family phage protein
MIPILISGPAVEPVDLAGMRSHLRVDGSEEDDLIAGLVTAARLLVEAAARRVLVAQTWRIVFDSWPAGRVLRLPLSPLAAVTRVAVADAAGNPVEFNPSVAEADPNADPPRLLVAAAVPDPGVPRGGILVEASYGYGAAPEDVPEPLRLAVKILVARWFENRGDLLGEQALPADAHALLAPFRRARL